MTDTAPPPDAGHPPPGPSLPDPGTAATSTARPPLDAPGEPTWPPPYPAYPAYPHTDGSAALRGDPVEAERARTSRTMATWALCLALVGIVPLLVVTGIGLAIAVLSRSSGSRLDHGRGRAIGALVVAGVWAVALVALVVGVAVHDARTGSEPVSASDRTGDGLVHVETGSCFNSSDFMGTRGGESVVDDEVDTVPCAWAHRFEAYDAFDLEDAEEYPGTDAVVVDASRNCRSAFHEFVGIGYGRSRLEVRFLHPTASTWDGGDREVSCVVFDPHGTVAGTLEDSRR